MGRRLPGAVRNSPRRLRHAAAKAEGERPVVRGPDQGAPQRRGAGMMAADPPTPMPTPPDARARRLPTLEVVAELAGVSRATVSRVVNGSPKVSPEVHAAVTRAINKLGYVPNRAARTLVTRRTDTLVLLMHEPPDTVFED